MQGDLKDHLLAQSAITAVVGQSIDWGRRPQGVLPPALVLHVISDAPQYADEGELDLRFTRVQIDIQAVTGNQRLALAAAVHDALSAQTFIQGDTDFRRIYAEGGPESEEPVNGGSTVFVKRSDFIIWHKEA